MRELAIARETVTCYRTEIREKQRKKVKKAWLLEKMVDKTSVVPLNGYCVLRRCNRCPFVRRINIVLQDVTKRGRIGKCRTRLSSNAANAEPYDAAPCLQNLRIL